MRHLVRAFAGIALAATLSSFAAQAEDARLGDLLITQPWSRATPGGASVAGGYLTIENKGAVADRLLGGAASIAGRVQLHEMSMADGVMTMRELDQGLALAPGESVKLAPGGYHLMLLDLKGGLKQGDRVPVTLRFEKAGKVEVTLDVQGVGAQAPGGSAGVSGGHGNKMAPGPSGMAK